ncbi:NAD(P)-binding protein [Thalassobacillus pellis]|uniref:NAD(P)-binding protein n=1 Tax=Thalassobacillus pellis TaxID=748008 RepID=UPI00195FB781|nr:NAD(P)-binding protein [Thalassobacillus pellis]MBM7551331.1 precorrin-2 dehydrogenase/sirohydrochlorin ferrochelatase [Thalassobacillus pellis]
MKNRVLQDKDKAIPLMISVHGEIVVIAGGGKVAAKRARTLRNYGAMVTIVSPEICPELYQMWNLSEVDWKSKCYEQADSEKAFMVVAATDNPSVNAEVAETSSDNLLFNDTADARRGNVQFPANVTRGDLTITVSTNGASPMLASKIKKDLEEQFDEDYEQYVDFLSDCRQLIKHSGFPKAKQKQLLRELLHSDYFNYERQQQTINWLKHLCQERGRT